MRTLAAIALVFWAAAASAQPAPEGTWSANFQANLYLTEEDDFLMPILGVDRNQLHLEARFQYEDLRTLSAWVGWTFGVGQEVHLDLVPMAGAIVGRTDGFAPGLEMTLTWKSIELYSESEYVFDIQGDEGDYYYHWSDLSWRAKPWLWFGLSGQRTRVYQSELDFERGLFAGVSRNRVESMLYLFNLDGESPFVIVAVSVDLLP